MFLALGLLATFGVLLALFMLLKPFVNLDRRGKLILHRDRLNKRVDYLIAQGYLYSKEGIELAQELLLIEEELKSKFGEPNDDEIEYWKRILS